MTMETKQIKILEETGEEVLNASDLVKDWLYYDMYEDCLYYCNLYEDWLSLCWKISI